MIRSGLTACAAMMLAGCAANSTPPVSTAPDHPEAAAYTTSVDTYAMADVDAALSKVAQSGKHVIIAMGANWCHDSRAFAGWLETPRFAALTAQHYEVVFVNVGMPQRGDTHNLAIARRFGIQEFQGTPTVLILSPEGELLNADSAKSWRNAASRSEDAIFDELTSYVMQGGE